MPDESERVPLPDLLRVAAHGNLVAVEALVHAGARLDETDALGWTAVTAAAAGGHERIVRLLAAKGASFTHQAKDGWTPLHAAAFGNHVHALEVLLELRVPADTYALSLAATLGHREVLAALLSRGAGFPDLDHARYLRARMIREGHRVRLHQSNFPGDWDDNAFGEQRGPSPEVQYVDRPMTLPDSDAAMLGLPVPFAGVTNLLLAVRFTSVDQPTFDTPRESFGGSELDQPTNGLITPLLAPHAHGLARLGDEMRRELLTRAANAGIESIVRLLLRDTDPGPQAIAAAAGRGHVEVVQDILAASGPAHASTALLRAASRGENQALRILLDTGASMNGALLETCYAPHIEAMLILLERGARVDEEESFGSTPLLVVADRGHVDALRVLIGHGAPVDGQNRGTGATPLMYAARNERAAAVRVLIEEGATVDLRDAHGQTALMRTVARSDYPNERSAARLLLDAGADPNLADQKGWTALMHAIDAPCVAMVELLLSRGAKADATDNEGRTVEDHARSSPYTREITALLRR